MGLDFFIRAAWEQVAFGRSELLIVSGNQEESIRQPGKDAKDSRIYTSGRGLNFIPAPRGCYSPR